MTHEFRSRCWAGTDAAARHQLPAVGYRRSGVQDADSRSSLAEFVNDEGRARTLLVKSLVVRGVVDLAILSGVLFGIAGRIDWPAAWLVILLFTGHLVLSGWWLLRHDPELIKERLTTASNVPHWDRLIARANRVVLLI